MPSFERKSNFTMRFTFPVGLLRLNWRLPHGARCVKRKKRRKKRRKGQQGVSEPPYPDLFDVYVNKYAIQVGMVVRALTISEEVMLGAVEETGVKVGREEGENEIAAQAKVGKEITEV